MTSLLQELHIGVTAGERQPLYSIRADCENPTKCVGENI